MTRHESAVLAAISGSLFWQPKPADEPAVGYLLSDGLIQPIRQGKLSGYAITPVGYVRWLMPHGQLSWIPG